MPRSLPSQAPNPGAHYLLGFEMNLILYYQESSDK